jgi:hypothetical protein
MTDKLWICTDPDQYQFGRKISERLYEFKEFDWFNIFPDKSKTLEEAIEMKDNWVELTINLNHYTTEEIENHISAYYDSIEQVKEIYDDHWEWILAECIFEQESQLY